ncbi:hypothetical protein [Dichotomicrobium thermohalophilum]|uniref:Secreted protein n=1 Tax=Dichotomicrobium thermohalophilum TaxID=933063 RepID=A0A397PD88_9HYPH|nr:hypothetical protein [Dichotomicrobium thermohalophilum]RIA47466.1 hypothetical protein BXY53_2547 [Dichotomicrobium thermohalophilum]
MTRLFALAAIALAPFATPALAQEACDPEARVVLDRAEPNEPVSELEDGYNERIIVSRFLNNRIDNCGPQQQQMQMVDVEEQQQQQPATN